MSTPDQPKPPAPRKKTAPVKGYTVINRESVADLENRVFQLLQEGWTPQGGVTRYGNRYLQAMVIR